MKNNILALLVAVFLAGCIGTPKPEVVVNTTNEIVHPSLPTPPPNPGVKILVITEENIKSEQAYVGFTYDEWLDFAKWMHSFKSYNADLRHVIELYKKQDPAFADEEEVKGD
ncbi:Rz-like spanin [Vibrio phage F86]